MYICCSLDKNEWEKCIKLRVEQYSAECILGDNRMRSCEELEKIILEQKLCILIIDNEFLKNVEALIEICLIKKLYEKKKIYVEAFLVGINRECLPHWLEWVKNVELYEHASAKEYILIADRLACKFWENRCNGVGRFTEEIKKYFAKDIYIKNTVKLLNCIRIRQDAAYISALYCLGIYINEMMENRFLTGKAAACFYNIGEQLMSGEPVCLERTRIMELCLISALKISIQ